MPAEVLYFGIGGIGGTFSYVIDQGGANVTLVCRSNYEIIKEKGLKFISWKYGEVNFKPERVFSNVADAAADRTYDYVVCSAKAYVDLSPSNAELLAPAISSNTVIVLIQNGIGIEKSQGFVDLFPKNPIVSCITVIHSVHEETGVVFHYSKNHLESGLIKGQDIDYEDAKKKLDIFADIVSKGGFLSSTSDDIQSNRWKKQCLNVPLNGFCALLRMNTRDIYSLSPFTDELVTALVLEVKEIAAACGTYLPDSAIHAAKEYGDKDYLGTKPSTFIDVARDRPLEVETIFGNALRAAEEKNINTPILRVVYKSLRIVHDRNCVLLGLKPKPKMFANGPKLDTRGLPIGPITLINEADYA